MNILGVGGWELAVIFIVALVFAGPKRMIQWAYIVGQYLGKMRIVWRNMMQTVQKEFDDAGVDIQVPKDIPTRNDIGRLTRDALEPFTAPMKQAMNEVEKETQVVQELATELKTDTSANGLHQTTMSDTADATDTSQNSFGTWSIGNDEE